LAIVTDCKNKYSFSDSQYRYSYADTLRKFLASSNRNVSKDSNSRSIPSEFYADAYCNVSLTIENETYEEMRSASCVMEFSQKMKFLDQCSSLVVDFVASKIDYIMDKAYESTQNNIYSLSLDFASSFYETDKEIFASQENIDV
jgi:hypothetical protein